MYPTLKIPMMMFGRFRRERAKRGKDGKTLKNSKGKYIKEKYWKIHDESNGDPGVYPSVNEIYQRVAFGRQRLTEPAENLMNIWATEAKMWAKDYNWEAVDEKVVLEITFYFPNDNKVRDTHNIDKLLMDSFSGILYKDDHTALPRVMDYHKVNEGEYAYLEINIYKKEDEDDIIEEKYRRAS